MDFSKFDNQINQEQLAKQMEEAKNNQSNNREVPAGEYNAQIEKMELGATKDGRPMFKVMMRIVRGDYKRMCLFMNRVIYGTKNDGNMIASVIGWLNNLDPVEPVEFKNYTQFSDTVLDVMEDIEGVEWIVDYDPEAFNSLSITGEVYEGDVPF